MTARAAVAVLASLLLLAGCGSSSDSGDSNDDDGDAAGAVPTQTISGDATAAPTPTVAPPSVPAGLAGTFATYVALGDSYTAAPGVPTTDTSTGCLQSSGNYPHLLAAAIGAELDDVSCSGASTTSLVGVQQTLAGDVPPQFDALGPDTSLVTMGIGGNDFNFFEQTVLTCTQLATSDPTGHPCRDQLDAGGKLASQIAVVAGHITAAAKGVKARSPRARIVVVGYPQLVPSTGTCDELPIAAGDYAFVRRALVELTGAVEKGARRAGVDYVDLLGPSKGHDVCSDDPWVNGSTTDVRRALAFHPFDVEQAAVAGLVAKDLSS